MGRVFLDPSTGRIFETSKSQKKPPKEFIEQLGKIDYRYYPRVYSVKSFFCPECRRYHAIFHLAEKFPLYKLFFAVYSSLLGCNKAKEIVEIGKILGGRRQHYDLALYIAVNPKWEKDREILSSLPEEEKKRLIKQLAKSLQNK